MMRRRLEMCASMLLAASVVLTGLALTATPAAAAGDSDERALVTASQLRDRPFRSIVLVAIGDRVVCTGFVVAPSKVATAGHCLTRDASDGDFRLRRDLPGGVRLYRAYSQIAGGATFGISATPTSGAGRTTTPCSRRRLAATTRSEPRCACGPPRRPMVGCPAAAPSSWVATPPTRASPT
jgi:hypothetical protein